MKELVISSYLHRYVDTCTKQLQINYIYIYVKIIGDLNSQNHS